MRLEEILALEIDEINNCCIVHGFQRRLDKSLKEEVIIPNFYYEYPVTRISEQAFMNCDSLKHIEIPNSITSIGNYAFSDCKSLESIEIPNTVTSIGESAFIGCTSLKEVIFEEKSQLTNIGKSVFYNCTSLESIEIPNSVTSIGIYAFHDCISLKKIEILNGVVEIAWGAFFGCTSLKRIEIPNSVTNIVGGAAIFKGCKKITSIEVDENNGNYQSIDGNLYSKDRKTLIQYAIGKTNSRFVIPNGVTSIGDWAFRDCTSLESIEIPNSVTDVGCEAFRDCTSLESIEIPESVTNVRKNAFWNCTILRKKEQNIEKLIMNFDLNKIEPNLLKRAIDIYKKNSLKNIVRAKGKIEVTCVGSSNEVYSVKLFIKDNQLQCNCNCLSFKTKQYEFCKHAIALIKTAQEQHESIFTLKEEVSTKTSEKPKIINDDYPFIYEKDIIVQINKARMNDENSIKFLIERYEKENNLIKMNYWKKRLDNISK